MLRDRQPGVGIRFRGEQIERGRRGAEALTDANRIESDTLPRRPENFSRQEHQQLPLGDVGIGDCRVVGKLARQEERDGILLAETGAAQTDIQRVRSARDFERDVVLLNARLEREVQDRLDLGRVREGDGAAPHLVRPSPEKHPAAFAQTQPPGQHRLGQGTGDRQLAGELEPSVVVVHDDVVGRGHRDVEPDIVECTWPGWRRWRSRRPASADQVEEAQAPPIVAAQNRDLASDRSFSARHAEREIGVHIGAQAIDELERHAASGQRQFGPLRRALAVREVTFRTNLSAVRAGRDAAELHAMGRERRPALEIRDRDSLTPDRDVDIRDPDLALDRGISRKTGRTEVDRRLADDADVRHEYSEHAQIDRALDHQVEVRDLVRQFARNR